MLYHSAAQCSISLLKRLEMIDAKSYFSIPALIFSFTPSERDGVPLHAHVHTSSFPTCTSSPSFPPMGLLLSCHVFGLALSAVQVVAQLSFFNVSVPNALFLSFCAPSLHSVSQYTYIRYQISTVTPEHAYYRSLAKKEHVMSMYPKNVHAEFRLCLLENVNVKSKFHLMSVTCWPCESGDKETSPS